MYDNNFVYLTRILCTGYRITMVSKMLLLCRKIQLNVPSYLFVGLSAFNGQVKKHIQIIQDKDYLVLEQGAETIQNYDVFHVFCLYFQANTTTVLQNWQWPIPFTPFPIRYSHNHISIRHYSTHPVKKASLNNKGISRSAESHYLY